MTSPVQPTVRSWQSATIVLTTALIVRVAYLVTYQSMPDWSMLTVDNYYHHHWAQVIAGGDVLGDTTYFRAPLYIWCLSAFYAVFGDSLWVGRLLGFGVGLCSVYMTYRIGRRLVSPIVGLISGLIHAVYPVAVYFESELLLDPLFTLLIQFAVYHALGWWQFRGVRIFVTTGLLFGLAAICRPTAMIWVVVFAFVPVVHYGFVSGIRRTALFLIGVALVIAPVTIRNVAVAGDPVLIASQGGINFYIGNNERADGVSAVLPEPLGHNWRIADIVHRAQTDLGRPLSPGEVSGYWTGKGLAWIWSNPADFASLYFKKVYFSFSNREVSNNRDLPAFFSRVWFLRYHPLNFSILLAFAAAGMCALWRFDSRVRWLVATIVVVSAAGALFFFASRFRLPLLPYLMILASAGGIELWRRRRQVSWLARIAASSIAAGFLSYLPVVALPAGTAAHSLLVHGSHYYAQGQYETARQWYAAAMEEDERFPDVNLNLGATWLRLGQADSARYYFEREIAYHPDRAGGWTNLGSLLLLEKRPDSAAMIAQAALDRRPYDPLAARVLIRAAAANPEVTAENLLTAIQHACRSIGRDVFVLNEAGGALLERGELEKADSLFQLASASTPPPFEMDDTAFDRDFRNRPAHWRGARSESHLQLSFIAGLRGDMHTVIEHCRAAISLDSTRIGAYINLSGALYRSGDAAAGDSVMSEAERRFGVDALRRLLPR